SARRLGLRGAAAAVQVPSRRRAARLLPDGAGDGHRRVLRDHRRVRLDGRRVVDPGRAARRGDPARERVARCERRRADGVVDAVDPRRPPRGALAVCGADRRSLRRPRAVGRRRGPAAAHDAGDPLVAAPGSPGAIGGAWLDGPAARDRDDRSADRPAARVVRLPLGARPGAGRRDPMTAGASGVDDATWKQDGLLGAGLAAAYAAFALPFRGPRDRFWQRMTLTGLTLGGLAIAARPELRRTRIRAKEVAAGLGIAAGLYGVFAVGDRMARR